VRRLEGKHAVVTGAGTGIGRAIAQRLHAEGARLTLLARDESRLRAVVPDAATRSVDIRDHDAVFAAIDEPLDFLVANAGIGGPNEPGECDRFDDIVRTNLYGTYWCVRAAERHLPDGGRVVVTSSILARIGVAGYTAYCASKAGLLGLVRSLAAELAPRAIQVNAVCPGWVNTEMAWQGLWPGPASRRTRRGRSRARRSRCDG
jgi:NAD(P)-dependent dehydrogenase (short-subunit alcohol dehydrogenase family)